MSADAGYKALNEKEDQELKEFLSTVKQFLHDLEGKNLPQHLKETRKELIEFYDEGTSYQKIVGDEDEDAEADEEYDEGEMYDDLSDDDDTGINRSQQIAEGVEKASILQSAADYFGWLNRKRRLWQYSKHWAVLYNFTLYLYNQDGKQRDKAEYKIPLRGGAFISKGQNKFLLESITADKKKTTHEFFEDQKKFGVWKRHIEDCFVVKADPRYQQNQQNGNDSDFTDDDEEEEEEIQQENNQKSTIPGTYYDRLVDDNLRGKLY